LGVAADRHHDGNNIELTVMIEIVDYERSRRLRQQILLLVAECAIPVPK